MVLTMMVWGRIGFELRAVSSGSTLFTKVSEFVCRDERVSMRKSKLVNGEAGGNFIISLRSVLVNWIISLGSR